MLVKSQVKYIQSLGHKKFRDTYGVFIAEGPKIVSELLTADNLILSQCFATETWIEQNQSLLEGKEKLVTKIDDQELQRISFHNSPNQVLAVFSKPRFATVNKPSGIILLLDTIQDPGNLGTILRTADWFGLKKIVCSEDTVDVFNPKVVQSAMGSITRVELQYTSLQEFIKSNADIPLYATSLHGEDLDEKIKLSDAFLLMGNESRGISADLEHMALKRIRIPKKGGAESLNVAVATGIVLSKIEMIS